jgi:hypothetical protein
VYLPFFPAKFLLSKPDRECCDAFGRRQRVSILGDSLNRPLLALFIHSDRLPFEQVPAMSAPAIVFSGPAQRSLTLRPARSRSRLATLYTESSDSFVASAAASIATVWSEPVPGRELHPLKSSAFHGALLRQLGGTTCYRRHFKHPNCCITILDEGYFGCRNTYAVKPAVLVSAILVCALASPAFPAIQPGFGFVPGTLVRLMEE